MNYHITSPSRCSLYFQPRLKTAFFLCSQPAQTSGRGFLSGSTVSSQFEFVMHSLLPLRGGPARVVAAETKLKMRCSANVNIYTFRRRRRDTSFPCKSVTCLPKIYTASRGELSFYALGSTRRLWRTLSECCVEWSCTQAPSCIMSLFNLAAALRKRRLWRTVLYPLFQHLGQGRMNSW